MFQLLVAHEILITTYIFIETLSSGSLHFISSPPSPDLKFSQRQLKCKTRQPAAKNRLLNCPNRQLEYLSRQLVCPKNNCVHV